MLVLGLEFFLVGRVVKILTQIPFSTVRGDCEVVYSELYNGMIHLYEYCMPVKVKGIR